MRCDSKGINSPTEGGPQKKKQITNKVDGSLWLHQVLNEDKKKIYLQIQESTAEKEKFIFFLWQEIQGVVHSFIESGMTIHNNQISINFLHFELFQIVKL